MGDVGALFAAATDRAHPRELAGEEAAVAAFREAHRLPAGSAGRNRRLVPVPAFVAGSLTAKIAVTLGVLSLGGIAVAAETGSLPAAAQSAAHRIFHAVGVPDADQRGIEQAGDGGQPTPSHGDGQQLDVTSPAIAGLCTAYLAGSKDEHGTALGSTALQALATAAGGADKIEALCVRVLAHPSLSPSASPSAVPTSDPSAPGQAPTSPEPSPSPAGSAGQTAPPTPTHATGPPTDVPTATNLGTP